MSSFSRATVVMRPRGFATIAGKYPKQYPILCNGEFIAPTSGRVNSEVRDPATQEILTTTYHPTAEEFDKVMQSAKDAFPGWKATPVAVRQRHMFKLLELMHQDKENLINIISDELGKTPVEAAGDLFRGSEVVEHACSTASLSMGESVQNVSAGIDTVSYREPLGVCAGITPFNYPAMMPLWMFPLGIATGNTYVLKPSSRVPLTSLRLMELCHEAGIPKGVVNCVAGGRELVKKICTHPDIQAISLVGGNVSGEAIYDEGSAHDKRVQSNMGAKNHVIVMPDANKEDVLNNLMGGAFAQCGQRCMSTPVAVFVGEAQNWISDLKPLADKIKVGRAGEPGVGLGPMVSPEAKKMVIDQVRQGEQQGATLLVDGLDFVHPKYPQGNFVGPTIMDNIKPDMECFTTELFGPVLQVMRVDTFEQALQLVNDSPYGNGSAIFTKNPKTARDFQFGVEAGMVGVNVPVPVPLPFFSFTGWKKSMRGDLNFFGKAGIHFFTKLRTVTTRWS